MRVGLRRDGPGVVLVKQGGVIASATGREGAAPGSFHADSIEAWGLFRRYLRVRVRAGARVRVRVRVRVRGRVGVRG